MNYKKILSIIGSVLVLGAAVLTGCKDETGNKEKYLVYSEYAGTTIGYIINASSVFVGPEVKNAITNVLTEIVTKLPKEVTAETIADDLSKIAADAVAAMKVGEKYKELVDKSVDTLLTLVQVGLTSVKNKHPVEFANGEMFYNIAYEFFNSINAVVDPIVSREANGEVSFEIADVKYAEIRSMAKADGKKIDKKAFDDIIAGINATK